MNTAELVATAKRWGRPISWFFGASDSPAPRFQGVSPEVGAPEVAWLAEFADTYCFLESALDTRRHAVLI